MAVATEVLRSIRDRDIRWVDLQFTDLVGYLRHMTVSSRVLTVESIENGAGKLDGSSIKGFTGVERSDLILKPIPTTFSVIPWESGLGRLICGVYTDSSRFSKDPRYAAERLDSHISDQGIELLVSAELEFFIFDRVTVSVDTWAQHFKIYSSEAPWSRTAYANRFKDGYYSVYPKDRFQELKIEIGDTLLKHFNIDVEVLHHEVAAASQHEINFRGGASAASTGDSIQTAKFVIKSIAFRKGFTATFIPKPIYGDNGSGMHIHISLWRGDTNLFYDPDDSYAGLSQYARYFIGGLLEHARALSAIVSPTVNSYKRLVPGYEAPVYLVWGKGNRSAAVRIPSYRRSSSSVRIEYRPPDPSANPYLAFTAVVLAGLDGVRRGVDPGDPIDENVYSMSSRRRRELGIGELPRSLDEALDELECDSEWLKPVVPSDLIESYIEVKREEARRIQMYPTPIELYSYLDV